MISIFKFTMMIIYIYKQLTYNDICIVSLNTNSTDFIYRFWNSSLNNNNNNIEVYAFKIKKQCYFIETRFDLLRPNFVHITELKTE